MLINLTMNSLAIYDIAKMFSISVTTTVIYEVVNQKYYKLL